MHQIFHGSNQVASREAFLQAIEAAKSKGEIKRVEARGLTLFQLEEVLGSGQLFSSTGAVALEGLLSLPRSANKEKLIAMVAAHTDTDIILWEPKEATAPQLRPFTQAKIKAFKTSPIVFAFADALKPGNTQEMLRLCKEAVVQESAEFVFAMLVRQVRLLLQLKDGGTPKMAPFMVGKVKKQASFFSLEQLLSLHTKLVELDEKAKTSKLSAPLAAELDLLLLQM